MIIRRDNVNIARHHPLSRLISRFSQPLNPLQELTNILQKPDEFKLDPYPKLFFHPEAEHGLFAKFEELFAGNSTADERIWRG